MASVFSANKQSRKTFEISLESPFVVFHGDVHEAEPVSVSGRLVLDTADHMNVRSIKVKIEGKWRVCWTTYGSTLNGNTTSPQVVRDKGQLLREEKQFVPAAGVASTTHRIAPGRHEWRFDFMLDPSLPESVEGLNGNYIVYNLSAEIDRGYMSKSLIATKHLRLIRTLGRDMSDTVPFPYSNEETWANKMKYHIYIPSRYFAFGTSIPVQFTLIPLRKGIRIGKIKMEIVERVTLEAHADLQQEVQTNTLSDKTVARIDQQQIPPESTSRLVEESSGISDESYHFEVILPLSKSLNDCRQSVSTDHIKVFHNLKIYVNIHNPDGHVSQLCLRNLVHLYISPETRINDDQTMVLSSTTGRDGTTPFNNEAPPTYGTHLLDQLYDDIDLSGFRSGVATPTHLLSRNQSIENLASRFTGLAGSSVSSDSDSSRSSSIAEPMASQLQSRLDALSAIAPGTSIPTGHGTNHGNKTAADRHQGQEKHQGRPSLRSGFSSLRNSIAFPHRRRSCNASPEDHPSDVLQRIDPPHTADTLSESHTQVSGRSASLGHPSAVQHTSALGGQGATDLSRIPSYNTAVSRPYIAHSANRDTTLSAQLPTYEDATSAVNTPQPSPPMST